MHLLLACIGLLAAITPWMVVRVAASRAGVFTRTTPLAPSVRAALRRLNIATMIVAAAVAVVAFLVTPPSLIFAAAALCAFGGPAVFGIAALQAIDLATHQARVVDTAERVASLQPRELGSHLPFARRLVPYALAAVGLTAFVYQLLQPFEGRRPFVAVGFALGGVVFLLLYEAWMREEVSGGQAGGGRTAAKLDRRVRNIFGMQMALVTASFVAANVLVRLDWTRHPETAVFVALAGGIAGVIGCANALASGLTGRRYAPVQDRRTSAAK
jgi:hypothetical protein